MRVIILLMTLRTGAFALFATSNGTSAANNACAHILSSLGSTVVQSFGTEYEAGASGAWNLFNDDYRPTCIVFPREASHVQVAMNAIYQAKSHYAAQAGGHTAMKGWNNVQDGVLILFSHMQNVSYDAADDTITLEPGVHWADAYSALEPLGVAPVGGRVGDVGMGLLLGGGLSFLSPGHGYAADSLKEVDVVLVTGEMVTATATNQFSDLFRALKGGGNRFGIVTRYKLWAVHTGTKEDKNYYGGTITYNSSAEALLKATARYVHDVKDSGAVLLVTFIGAVEGESVVPIYTVNLFYKGSHLPPSIFGDFLAIPAISSQLGPLSYFEVANFLGLGADRGNGQLYGASALIGEETLFLDAFRHWTNFTEAFKDSFDGTGLAFTPVLDPQIHAGRKMGGNVMDPPLGGFAAVQMAEQFRADVAAVPSAVQTGLELLFEQIPRSSGLPLFLNECDQSQDVFETYGQYTFLKEVYHKYDPTRFNVDHTEGPVGL